MTSRLRQVLTFVLLLIFSLENVTLAIMTTGHVSSLSQSRQYVQQRFQSMNPLLAEENEERDFKDEAAVSFSLTESVNFSPMHLSALAAGMKRTTTEIRLQGKFLPRYTVFCSFIL